MSVELDSGAPPPLAVKCGRIVFCVAGAVLLMEVAGMGGPQLFAVMLPALLASGVGDLIFTGFVHWTQRMPRTLFATIASPVPLPPRTIPSS